ncbi:hypothetical protein K435DRAFT_794179 [Dendrothele bispora CBS 962.96]|uniref:Uncharacterized protein n=1 Tax=Dendrothele bispora (strain CBS 962.96) TaxID=1314807 RepID=A0A4V4HGW5_DENBC|nr:hypothetical protein K435DRAFT_794179 [Dendrothele bispora CBS 962.96]
MSASTCKLHLQTKADADTQGASPITPDNTNVSSSLSSVPISSFTSTDVVMSRPPSAAGNGNKEITLGDQEARESSQSGDNPMTESVVGSGTQNTIHRDIESIRTFLPYGDNSNIINHSISDGELDYRKGKSASCAGKFFYLFCSHSRDGSNVSTSSQQSGDVIKAEENNGINKEQQHLVKLAEEELTNKERDLIRKRHEKVTNLSDSRGEGSSDGKGKAVDPRNWGAANLNTEELNVEAQKRELEHWSKGREGKITSQNIEVYSDSEDSDVQRALFAQWKSERKRSKRAKKASAEQKVKFQESKPNSVKPKSAWVEDCVDEEEMDKENFVPKYSSTPKRDRVPLADVTDSFDLKDLLERVKELEHLQETSSNRAGSIIPKIEQHQSNLISDSITKMGNEK